MITTERCLRVSECGNQTQEVQREPSTYQPGSRYQVSDMPSQSTTEADHYEEVLELSTYQNAGTSPEQHLEFLSDDDEDDEYDQPGSSYDRLDSSAVVNRRTPPKPSVYDRLTP